MLGNLPDDPCFSPGSADDIDVDEIHVPNVDQFSTRAVNDRILRIFMWIIVPDEGQISPSGSCDEI